MRVDAGGVLFAVSAVAPEPSQTHPTGPLSDFGFRLRYSKSVDSVSQSVALMDDLRESPAQSMGSVDEPKVIVVLSRDIAIRGIWWRLPLSSLRRMIASRVRWIFLEIFRKLDKTSWEKGLKMKAAIVEILAALVRAALNSLRRLLGLSPLGPDTTSEIVDVADAAADGVVHEVDDLDEPEFSTTLLERIRTAARLRADGAPSVHLFNSRLDLEAGVSGWMMWMPTAQAELVAVAADEALADHVMGRRLMPGVDRVPVIASTRHMLGDDHIPQVAMDPAGPSALRGVARPALRKAARKGPPADEPEVGDDVIQWMNEFMAEREAERRSSADEAA